MKESSDHLVLAFGRPYKRIGKSTLRMSKDEYERLILDKHKDKLYITPEEALRKLNLIKKDKLINAAILLFGKNPQKFFLQAETRCARFKGNEPLEFIKEHIQLHGALYFVFLDP